MKGPNRHIKCRNQWVPRKGAEILSATLTLQGQEYNLLQNKFSVSSTQDPTKVYIYHSYDYLIEGQLAGGRWYNTEFPVSQLLQPGTDIFQTTLDFYEINDSGSETAPATFCVTFTPKAAAALRAEFGLTAA